MKTQGFEARFSQNLAPVSREKPQNRYLAYISHLFSKPYLLAVSLTAMFNQQDDNLRLTIINGIDNPIVSNPEAILLGKFSL